MESANGSNDETAHQPFPSHSQITSGFPRNRRPNPMDVINNGGLGHPSPSTLSHSRPQVHDSVPAALDVYDKQYLPHQAKSLSGIASRSLLLGVVLTASTNATIYLLIHAYTPLWRAPFFLATLSLFHYLEFWTTAAYNTREAKISSFLLSANGYAYNAAHTFAMLELLTENYFWGSRSWLPPPLRSILLSTGLVLIIFGQVIRSMAMRAAGTNFNHIVQSTKRSSHKLVTTGVYSYFRHPSYFGFFWWALGTQLVLGNGIAFFAYWVVLWRFFSVRIEGEEEYLVKFFGDEYLDFRKRTRVGIPLVW